MDFKLFLFLLGLERSQGNARGCAWGREQTALLHPARPQCQSHQTGLIPRSFFHADSVQALVTSEH